MNPASCCLDGIEVLLAQNLIPKAPAARNGSWLTALGRSQRRLEGQLRRDAPPTSDKLILFGSVPPQLGGPLHQMCHQMALS